MNKSKLRKKIDVACAFADISQAELARRIGLTPQVFNVRLNACRFTAEELEKIASALGAVYSFNFEFPDGTKI